MSQEFDYYLIDGENNPNYPALDYKDADDEDFFFEREPISNLEKVEMCLWKPKPKKPEMVDFHSAAGVLAFSEAIYHILYPLNLHQVQFIPATIEVKKGIDINGYWLMHNYNRIECMDLAESDCDIDKSDNTVTWIRKIVLSSEKLGKIPLNERLFFRMKEDYPTHLVHKSIVDKIMSIKPVGLKFTSVERWRQGMQFD